MGGNPKKRAQIEKLEAIGEDVIFEMREEGKSVTAICRHFEVGPRALYGWMGREDAPPKAVDEDGKSRRDRWNEASAAGAERLAERPGERFDRLVGPDGRMKDDVTREEITLAKVAGEHDVWMAGALDGKRFGGESRKSTGPVININELHLTAVQAIAAAKRTISAAATTPAALPAESADYEIVEEEDDDVREL